MGRHAILHLIGRAPFTMKLLDRYILRLFLLNFIILLVVIMAMIVMVDMMFNLDEFMDAGRRIAEVDGASSFLATVRVILDYYIPQVCFIYVYLAGLIVIAAMGFTFTALSRTGELVTLIASGISLHRAAAPVLVAACLINGLTLVDQELIIPRFIDKLTRKVSELKTINGRAFAVHYADDSKRNLISAARFDPATNRLESVTILEDWNQRDRAARRITASAAVWDDAGHRWVLENARAVRRSDAGDRSGMIADSRVELIDAFATDVSPQVLMARRAAIYPALLSMSDLSRLMTNPAADQPAILRIMHSRFSLMIFNVLVLVIVIPLFVTREPVNPLQQAVNGAAISIGSWMTGVGMLQLMGQGISPVVAAWIPVVIFLPISAMVLQKMKT